EPLVDGVVDDVNLRIRDVEVAQDVALGRLRDRDHAAGPVRRRPHLRARVRVAQLARQVLREAQVDAVVNGDDRPAGGQRRQHVGRRGKELAGSPPQIDRNRELLRDRVRLRRLDDRAEPRPELLHRFEVRLATEHDVVVRVLLARELPQQVPHVRADPVVTELAGVDGNPHGGILFQRRGGWRLRTGGWVRDGLERPWWNWWST